MVTTLTSHAPPNLGGLKSGTALRDQELALIEVCATRATSFDAGREIAAHGAPLHGAKYILSGWVGQVRLLDDGRRQIVNLTVTGELTAFDLHPHATAKGAYVCLTPVRVADVGELFEKAMTQPDRFPGLVSLFQAADDRAHSRLLDQIVRAGRMLAHERMAHFALDLHRRLSRLEPGPAKTFPMPLTQEVLGDILGLSTVHINRTIQQLRREHLLRTGNGRWEILDMERMVEVASGARP